MQAKPIATYLLTGFLLIALLLPYTGKGSKSDVPLLNPKGFLELSHNRIKREFETGCKDMLLKWFASNPDKAVRLNCDTGTATVLPPKFAVEVRNDERFDLFAFLQDVSAAEPLPPLGPTLISEEPTPPFCPIPLGISCQSPGV